METHGSKLLSVAFVMLHASLVVCQPKAKNTYKMDKMGTTQLQSMLKSTMEQNRRLERQNMRLNMLWDGLQQMCGVLQRPSGCNCSSGNYSGHLIPKHEWNATRHDSSNYTTGMGLSKEMFFPTMHVTSSGIDSVSNTTTVSVKYSAPGDHTVDWVSLHQLGGMHRSRSTERHLFGENNYTSRLRLNPSTTQYAVFRVFENKPIFSLFSIVFNISALTTAGEQTYNVSTGLYADFNRTYIAPEKGDLNVTFEIRGNIENILEGFRGVSPYFTGLNTSASPPEMFEVLSFNSESLSHSVRQISEEHAKVVITISEPLVQLGGILGVVFSIDTSGLARELNVGYEVHILNPKTKEVVPYGKIGMYPLKKETYIAGSSETILCAAIGSQPPRVSIVKVDNRGRETPVAGMPLLNHDFLSSTTLSLYKRKRSEGKYICRASLYNTTLEQRTEVIIAEVATFDDGKTGVTKNTTKKIVITCKASGVPRPNLEMVMWYSYGPALTKSKLFKVSRHTPNRKTAKVTLTIPANDTIHTIYCVAQQMHSQISVRKIEVFPFDEHRYYSYDLYSRLLNETTYPQSHDSSSSAPYNFF